MGALGNSFRKGHRKRDLEKYKTQLEIGRRLSTQDRCIASGVSFGSLGPTYLTYTLKIIHAAPKVKLVTHTRSNHVKHGLSHLRTTCPREKNHLFLDTASTHGKHTRLYVPPMLLWWRATQSAKAQEEVLHRANSIDVPVVYNLVYEALQADLPGEMNRLLLAVGALPPSMEQLSQSLYSPLAKASSEDLRDMLVNFDEIEAKFSTLSATCLHRMLIDPGHAVFPPGGCPGVLQLQEELRQYQQHAEATNRLNASECSAPAPEA